MTKINKTRLPFTKKKEILVKSTKNPFFKIFKNQL